MSPKEIIEIIISVFNLLFSWPVIFLCIIILFRKQISSISQSIIDRLTKIKTSFVEVELEPKIVQTNLGQTEISKVTVKQNSVGISVIEGFQGMYVGDNFYISWPTKSWEGNSETSKEIPKLVGIGDSEKRKYSLFIGRKENVKDFKPNVNVLLELATYNSMKKFLPLIYEQYTKIGWQLLSSQNDDDDQGGFIEFQNLNNPVHLYQFQRLALAFGRLYVVTATVPIPTTSEEIGIIEDLSSIVNSFRIII
jgi:hypothetical protein